MRVNSVQLRVSFLEKLPDLPDAISVVEGYPRGLNHATRIGARERVVEMGAGAEARPVSTTLHLD